LRPIGTLLLSVFWHAKKKCEDKNKTSILSLLFSTYYCVFFMLSIIVSLWYASNSEWFIFVRALGLFLVFCLILNYSSVSVVVFFPLLFLPMYACTCHTDTIKDRQNKTKDVHYYRQASLHFLQLPATWSHVIIMMWCDDDDDNIANTCAGSWALLLAQCRPSTRYDTICWMVSVPRSTVSFTHISIYLFIVVILISYDLHSYNLFTSKTYYLDYIIGKSN
jgi:hypothetical protein